MIIKSFLQPMTADNTDGDQVRDKNLEKLMPGSFENRTANKVCLLAMNCLPELHPSSEDK